MTKKLFLLFSTLTVLSILKVNSQVSSYSFTQGSGSYGPANTGSLVGTVLQDDDVTSINLPFTFTFNGTPYTNLDVCANGYVSFATLTGTEYTAISDGTTQAVIAPFADDLFMGTVVTGDYTIGSNTITNLSSTNGLVIGDSLADVFSDFGGINPVITGLSGNNIILNIPATGTSIGAIIFFMNGSIRQSVSGTAPNRICELQYKNMTRIFVLDEVVNFKVRLYETSNKIEVIYGLIFPATDQTAPEVGLKGTSSSDFNSRKVNQGISWSNSVPSVVISDACAFGGTDYPQNGLRYVWTTTDCAAPAMNVTQTSNVICAGETSTLVVSGAASYTWSTGSNATQITVSPNSTQTYTVTGGTNGCISATMVTQNVSLCTGIGESLKSIKNFMVYPNPSKGKITIKNDGDATNSEVKIYNVLGAMVYSAAFENSKELLLDTELLEGIYLIELITNKNNRQVKQIVIEK